MWCRSSVRYCPCLLVGAVTGGATSVVKREFDASRYCPPMSGQEQKGRACTVPGHVTGCATTARFTARLPGGGQPPRAELHSGRAESGVGFRNHRPGDRRLAPARHREETVEPASRRLVAEATQDGEARHRLNRSAGSAQGLPQTVSGREFGRGYRSSPRPILLHANPDIASRAQRKHLSRQFFGVGQTGRADGMLDVEESTGTDAQAAESQTDHEVRVSRVAGDFTTQ